MKDELWIQNGLKAKTYSYLTDDGSEDKKDQKKVCGKKKN